MYYSTTFIVSFAVYSFEMDSPITRLADELEQLGMTVDRTDLLQNKLMAADDDTVLWAHVPARGPNYGLYRTRPLAPSESPEDIEDISPLTVSGPEGAQPYEDLDVDIYGLFTQLDALQETVQHCTSDEAA